MKVTFRLLVVLTISLMISQTAQAQAGDVRGATGLPISIGSNVIFGQITIKGITKGERKPTIYVTLFLGGAQTDRAMANDEGYFYFQKKPENGASLVVEVNGEEIGRQILTSAEGNRYDFTVNWASVAPPSSRLGVVSVRDLYDRNDNNSKLFDKADTAREQKKDAEAIALFLQIIANDKKDFVVWTELASIYFAQAKYTDAESAYNKALELNPVFMVALMNLGKLNLVQKQNDKAIAVFYKAVSTSPNSPDAFEYLGEAYLMAKQGSKAVIALNEAIRLAPKEKADIHLRLATLYKAAGQKPMAANEYRQFLLKKPDFPEKQKLQKYIDENSK